MIRLLVTRARQYPLTAWLASRHAVDLGVDFRPLPYEDLENSTALAPGAYLFTDMERFRDARLALARRVWETLSEHPDRFHVFNDPRRLLGRFDLLARLHAEGINDFRAVRATDCLDGLRYPVFVRQELDHTGSRTPLLESRAELDAALRRLGRSWQSGLDLRSLLVVEFVDTSIGGGQFLNYSAFKVGDRILPRYRVQSDSWIVKARTRNEAPEVLEAEAEYVATNPHADWIERIFAIAGVDYGRLDYGVANGRLQAWEINTNPTVGPRLRRGKQGRGARPKHPAQVASRTMFHTQLCEELRRIDAQAPATGPPTVFRPERGLVGRARREGLRETIGRGYRVWVRKPAGMAWRAVLAAGLVWGTSAIVWPRGAIATAADLVLLLALVASLSYLALRTKAGTAYRSLACGLPAAAVPLVDVAAIAPGTGFDAAGLLVAILSRAAMIGVGVGVLLRGRVPRSAGRAPTLRDAANALLVAGIVGGATALAAVALGATGPPWWMALRGPLLMASFWPLLARQCRGRWSPALAAAIAATAATIAGWSALGLALVTLAVGNGLLGALLGAVTERAETAATRS